MSERMGGQTPSPEREPSSPTEASKSFLRRAWHTIEDTGIALTPGGVFALGFIRWAETLEKPGEKVPDSTVPQKVEEPTLQETIPSSPTEASEGFLRKTREQLQNDLTLKKAWPYILPFATVITERMVSDSIPTDIAQGDYKSAVVKGAIAGLSIAPLAYKTFRRG